LEVLLWLLNLGIFCAQVLLLIAAIQGRPFLAKDRGRWNRLFLALWGVSLIEVLLAVIQRSVIKIADPYPLSRLEAVLSPRQAALRFFCQIYLEWILYLFFFVDLSRFCEILDGRGLSGVGKRPGRNVLSDIFHVHDRKTSAHEALERRH